MNPERLKTARNQLYELADTQVRIISIQMMELLDELGVAPVDARPRDRLREGLEEVLRKETHL